MFDCARSHPLVPGLGVVISKAFEHVLLDMNSLILSPENPSHHPAVRKQFNSERKNVYFQLLCFQAYLVSPLIF